MKICLEEIRLEKLRIKISLTCAPVTVKILTTQRNIANNIRPGISASEVSWVIN